MKVTRRFKPTGQVTTLDLDITQEQLDRFENIEKTRETIDDIFPNLSKMHKTFFISGMSPMVYIQLYGEVTIDCKDKNPENIINELKALPIDTTVALNHWNGKKYVTAIETHLLEMEDLINKKIASRNNSNE